MVEFSPGSATNWVVFLRNMWQPQGYLHQIMESQSRLHSTERLLLVTQAVRVLRKCGTAASVQCRNQKNGRRCKGHGHPRGRRGNLLSLVIPENFWWQCFLPKCLPGPAGPAQPGGMCGEPDPCAGWKAESPPFPVEKVIYIDTTQQVLDKSWLTGENWQNNWPSPGRCAKLQL